MIRRVELLALVLSVALGVVGTAPASAACATITESGDLVFVGTAVSTTNGGRFARFAVEEIWSGDASLAPNGRVTIVGGPYWTDLGDDGQFVFMEHEHIYDVGGRYLVVATNDQQWVGMSFHELEYPAGALSDGPCTISAPWTDELAADRPADAQVVEQDEPIGPEPWNDSSPPYLMIGLTTVLVAGGCLYLLLRRGSIAYRARQDDEVAE